MADERHDIITACLGRLEELNGEDFHGYRSEVYSAVSIAITSAQAAQAAKYRACAEAARKYLKIISNNTKGAYLNHNHIDIQIALYELRAALAGLEG